MGPHTVSDIGITGLLGAKLASFGAQHYPGIAYTLYLLTFGLDSAGDVFGSVFAFAAGVLVIGSGVLPRWLGWVSILAGIMFFVQGFGLGGVIASFGLILDLIGFVLFPTFVLVSSVLLLRRQSALLGTAAGIGQTTWSKRAQFADGLVRRAARPDAITRGVRRDRPST